MLFSIEVLDLLLYCVQQLGVMLAVGAETIVLISYIVALRDRKVEETEARFSRAIHRALAAGIACIVLSGLAITAVHESLGEVTIVFAPVFLFKWLLIFGLLLAYLWQRRKPFSHFLVEGAIGGTWYALFLVHILAPVTTWFNLLTLYAVFVVGFVVLWSAVVALMRERPKQVTKVVAAPPAAPVQPKKIAPIAPPPPPQPPVAPPVAPPVVPIPQAPPVVAPIVVKKEEPPPTFDVRLSHWLPAIHVMPKTPAQLEDKSHITPAGAVKKTT